MQTSISPISLKIILAYTFSSTASTFFSLNLKFCEMCKRDPQKNLLRLKFRQGRLRSFFSLSAVYYNIRQFLYT